MSNITLSCPITDPKAIIHIVHGMSEHMGRYKHFAQFLNGEGYAVFGNDLKGHGFAAGEIENVGFFAEKDGWNIVVQDVIDLTHELKAAYPGKPLYILGHSMGSFIARSVIIQEPNICTGLLLSATIGHPGWKGYLGKPLAAFNAGIFGKKGRTELLTNISFGHFNRKIKNPRTKQDWLSRDPEMVDAYINDPYCMQTFTWQFYYDMAHGLLEINKSGNYKKVNKDMRLLIISGTMDPAGEYGKGPKEVYSKFLKAGVKDIHLELVKEGRHELLNETNRDEVYQILVDWIENKSG